MSGNVTGWVFGNYPVKTATDRNRKMVLSAVAECANYDGDHAHPGVPRIAGQWGFDPTTVRRHLKALVADGWLEITSEGGGRGNATVFRVCMERGARRPGLDDDVNAGNAGIVDDKRGHRDAQTRAFSDSSRMSQAIETTPKENTPRLLTQPDSIEIVFAAWAESTNRTGRVMLTPKRRRLIEQRLKEGYTVDVLLAAVRGWAFSPWHAGANPERKVYNSLELLLRDAKQVEMFSEAATGTEPAPNATNDPAVNAVMRLREMEGRA